MVEARRHILAILQDYPSLRPPIDHLCELLPRLQARYYSIASSSKVGMCTTQAWPTLRRHCAGSQECGPWPQLCPKCLEQFTQDSLGCAASRLHCQD